MNKCLVIYYSLEGNTKYAAEIIAKEIGADTLRLEPVKDIKNNAVKNLTGGKDVIAKKEPELKPFNVNIQEYDILIIGTPVWAGNFVPAVRTLLSKYNIEDKKIALFSCHAGGKGKTLENMKEILSAKNTVIGMNDFIEPLKEKNDEEIVKWAKSLMETG